MPVEGTRGLGAETVGGEPKPGHDLLARPPEGSVFRRATHAERILASHAKTQACCQLRTGPVSIWMYLERG